MWTSILTAYMSVYHVSACRGQKRVSVVLGIHQEASEGARSALNR